MTSVIRNDGAFVNALSGLGTELDKGEATRPKRATRLTQAQKEDLAEDPILQNICYAYPAEGTRAGWQIVLGGEKQDLKTIAAFDEYRETVGGKTENEDLVNDAELFKVAQYFANIYRGAVLVLDVDDGRSPNEPIDYSRIRTIRSIEVMDGYRVLPDLSEHWNALRPMHYNVMVAGGYSDRLKGFIEDRKLSRTSALGGYTYRVHRSRIIRFDGRDGKILPNDAMIRNDGWGQSTIDACWDAFKSFGSVYQSVAAMLADASVFAYFLKNLSEQIEAGNEEIVRRRFRLLRMGIKVLGGAALDADNERIEWVSRNFNQIPELSDRFKDLLIAVSNLPSTKVFGRGPLGLAAQGTGEAEERSWAQDVNTWQTTYLRPRLRRLYRLIWLAKDGPTNGKEPENWRIQFNPLIIQTEQEKMDVRSAAATTYTQYLNAGVLLPDEVRNSQFGGAEYSIEIALDNKLWDEQKKQAEQESNFGNFADFGQPAFEQPTEEVPQEEPAQVVQQDSLKLDSADFTDTDLHARAKAEAKQKFKIFPSAYASAWLVRRYKQLYKEKHGKAGGFRQDDLNQWFGEKWVRISGSGEILGECGDRSEREGKPKCLPLAKARAMPKEERVRSVRRKRREDPDKNRSGAAKIVET